MNRAPMSLVLALVLALPGVPAWALRAPMPAGPALFAESHPTWTLPADEEAFDFGDADDMERLRGDRNAPIMIDDGVLFRLDAVEARHVSVIGRFNDWDPEASPLTRRRSGVWETTLDLDPGRWPYLFVVDGEWRRDPDNPVLTPVPDDEAPRVGEASMVYVKRHEVFLPRPHGFHEGDGELAASYDRVNQLTLSGELSYRNRVELHPDLTVAVGRSFGRERWLYDLGLAQPLFGPEIVDLGAKAYRRNATPDDFRIATTENSLAAIFFRQDWRDYHEAEGLEAFARAYVGSSQELCVTWRREEQRSVSKTTDWGLFEGDRRMRLNLPIDDGRLRSLTLAWSADTRNHRRNPSRGWRTDASWEWAGHDLGGDFEFQRGKVDLRRYLKLTPDHFLDIRVLGGAIEDARRDDDTPEGLSGFEAIPVQERFYLGGIGTMRATRFKSLAGDRVFLANVESRVEIFRDFQVVVFTDLGDAWVEDTADFDLKVDAGIGFQDSDANFRVNLARKVDDRDGDDGLFVSARINRMF